MFGLKLNTFESFSPIGPVGRGSEILIVVSLFTHNLAV